MNNAAPADDLTAQLQTAYARRAAARAKATQTAEAANRGRAMAAAARADADAAAREEDDWIARHRSRLEKWIGDGHSGQPPAAVPSDKAYTAKRALDATLAAATGAAATLAAAEEAAQLDLAAAEREVIGIVAAMLDAEAVDKAATIINRLAELEALIRELQVLSRDQLHTPINQLRNPARLPQIVESALDLGRSLALHRELNTPVRILAGLSDGLDAERAALSQRRAQLIAGQET